MRLGVLDVGSNTVRLVVVDARLGAAPTPAKFSDREPLRLAEQLTESGDLSAEGIAALVRAVQSMKAAARRLFCKELMAFATSAVRDAKNSEEVLGTVLRETGVELTVLTGQEEAVVTFLAVRRWYGWSAGQLLVLDIGGGSLEVAMGAEEHPDMADSLPLGAGRITRTRFSQDPPTPAEVMSTSEWLDDQLSGLARTITQLPKPDRVVATSRTFRILAELTGAAPASKGLQVRRTLSRAALTKLIPDISGKTAEELRDIRDEDDERIVSRNRAHQVVAGALVAEATMRALDVDEMEICPWALREGLILRRLDRSNGRDDITAAEWRA